ncbi:RagB/SusD family nutrient uptake outer membrane protein [Flavobacterium chuncheonense]|uniref:RagB/SusD family nutrient uptake outer membrane protein n=1 Tax=Flavobacterium chuncheonense TaxID=2026653 RepID=A0ABW5YKT2_9FLAO
MKIKNLLLPVILLAFGTYSCTDAYEIDAADEIIDGNAITNIDDLSRAMNGAYAGVGGQSFVAWSSYFTDECRKPSTNRGQGVQVHTWSINDGTDEPASYYSGLYSTINRANVVLERMDNFEVASPEDAALREQYRGELLTIRAMAHFDLMRFFATSYDNPNALATPIATEVFVLDMLARNTVGEVVSFVKSDLMTALDIFNTYGNDNDVTKVTPTAVKAILARLALYTKDYDAAIAYSQEVMNAVPLAATPTDYIDIWSDASDAEIIFKLKRVQGNGQIGRIFKDANGDVFFNVSNGLFSTFQQNDIRFFSLIDLNESTLQDLQVGKYIGPSSNYGLADIKLFRVAEMYLINAEAHALKATPNFTAAETAINALRASRRLDAGALPNLTFTDQNDAINKILLERRKELAFEGHRFFDLKRFNRGVDRLPSDVELNTFAEDLDAGDYRFTLPIPSAALFANDLLVQNPIY